MALLRLDNTGHVERFRIEHHANQHEADRDLVRDHLRRRPHRGEEGVFRVARPPAHHHAVNTQRTDREDVKQPYIDIGQHYACIERDHCPCKQRDCESDDRREQEYALVRRRRNDRLLQKDLEAISEALQQSKRPDNVRPAPQHDRAQHLAVDIDHHCNGQHQRQRDQQNAGDCGDKPCPFVGHAERSEEFGHQSSPPPQSPSLNDPVGALSAPGSGAPPIREKKSGANFIATTNAMYNANALPRSTIKFIPPPPQIRSC